jgi:hypothetical protein
MNDLGKQLASGTAFTCQEHRHGGRRHPVDLSHDPPQHGGAPDQGSRRRADLSVRVRVGTLRSTQAGRGILERSIVIDERRERHGRPAMESGGIADPRILR